MNFRCLKSVEVSLTPITILIGENNAGKTSFLDAIYAAVGSGSRYCGEEDVYLAPGESQPPRDRLVAIDVLVVPADGSGNREDTFPEGSPWLELWGNGIVQDDSDRDMVGIRMTMSWDKVRGEYYIQRRFLKEWAPSLGDMTKAAVLERTSQVTTSQITPWAMYLLDAKRDAAEDIKARGSSWSRLVTQHGLADEDIKTIEEQLSNINEFLVEKSGVLSHVQENLHQVASVVNCAEEDVSVSPVARRLRDLSRGMDIVLATRGAPQFPLARHGMGTRSLASVLMFKAYMTWRQKQGKTAALHPFVAVEEPETHLHPQAQRALFAILADLPGQTIISTHSPYVCSQSRIDNFVHFYKEGHESVVTRFAMPGSPDITPDERHAIDRRVLNTRGDLLFSRCVVLFEGETEEQAYPEFARRYWGKHPNELGISFIGVGGSGGYLPFLRLATRFRIPWVIISDGDADAVQRVESARKTAGATATGDAARCVILPNGKSFEEYITNADTVEVLQRMLAEYTIERNGVSDPRGVKGIIARWSAAPESEVLQELQAGKTTFGARVADAFGSLSDQDKRIPEVLRKAFDIAYPPISRKE
jgi:putative ATP-dependent endonuclease of OLD family